ncbi:hypothetical protein [Sinomonas gamaensis]|uniref:hypothetical protein n=1 Tax=Sinomonas gamaensis TaxID=2565624 RepID=UPI001109D2DF|nr:hypothetical protein [Sinomonas gamaensis]
MTETRSIQDICSDFMRALEKAVLERPARQEFVDGLPGWVSHEREVMHEAVNAERVRIGLPPVDIEEVRRVEARAFGRHSFAARWAIGCACIALGKEPPA